MQEDVFRRIVDEVSGYHCGIRFCRQGEPALHDKLTDFISYAKKKNVLQYVSTNGFFSHEKMHSLVRAQPDVIRFSFQGLTKDEFERYRVPSKYDSVVENIRIASAERKENQWTIPFLIIGTSITTETDDDVAAFRAHWESVVDLVEFGRTSFAWVEQLERAAPLKGSETVTRRYKPCMEVRTKLSVNWNGDICACCSDQDGHFVLGNIATMSLKQAWSCDKEEYLRTMVGTALRHSELPHCQKCFIENYKFSALKEKAGKE
jgi:radical SAM protein with 4Fe4S-binding SPASM domain